MTEQDIMRSIMLAPHGARLFRNNVGTGWTANKIDRVTKPGMIYIQPGDVVVRNARPLHAGLCTGSSDLIGIRPITITADMIGKTIGVFVALEVKTPKGKPTDEQINFIQRVRDLGGFAGVARSVEEALNITSCKH
jgi:hypothetical protein